MNKKNLRASAAILFFTVIWMISGYFAQSEPVEYEAPVEKEVVLVAVSEAKDFSLPVTCLLYTSPSPRDRQKSRMPSSA